MLDNATDKSAIWRFAEANIDSLQPVPGGFSGVKKGLLTLPDGRQVFVKLGIDENTNKWTRKEVELYELLGRHEYRHMPKLIATKNDNTGLVLEALTESDGWQWHDKWDDDRLNATLAAMDDLAKIELSREDKRKLETKALSESDDGWLHMYAVPDLKKALISRLVETNRQDIVEKIDEFTKQSSHFVFSNTTFVHNDIRADNCAWNPNLRQVRLIDWNWAQIGDTRIDTGSLLVNIQKTGFDILHHTDKLDKDALIWMAGFWLARSSVHTVEGRQERLAAFQFHSGITALDLADKL